MGSGKRGFPLLLVASFMSEKAFKTENHPEKSRLRRYAPMIIWMALIFFASSGEFSASNTNILIQPLLRWLFPHITDERILVFHFLLRKCGHFSAYAILAWLAARAFMASSHASLRHHWFVAALFLVCLYALLDEYHQSFVPSRTASIYDSLIDMLGGLTLLTLTVVRNRKRRGSQNTDALTESALFEANE
jgi:VanZ family protein